MKEVPRLTQEDKILALLRSRGVAWTSAPELSKISLQYCRAVRTLRKRGHAIENRVEMVDGKRHGFYRLKPIETSPRLALRAVAPPAPQPNSLFGDLLPDRSYRE